VHVLRACSQPQGAQHIHTGTIEVEDVTGEIALVAAHMDVERFAFSHGGIWKVGVFGGLIYGGAG